MLTEDPVSIRSSIEPPGKRGTEESQISVVPFSLQYAVTVLSEDVGRMPPCPHFL